MKTTASDYRHRVMSCWLGKAVGGTLGQPYEGYDGPLDLTFYDPVPTDMIPNDDLDLQVLWACVLDKMSVPVIDRDVFADAWRDHVAFPWDEYGIAIRNLRSGLRPPYTGIYDNWFVDGLGAAIRSEIWACLAPGQPELAAQYACEDAVVDHRGDGIHAEMFLAALESAAFGTSDIEKLLDTGLSVIPSDCRLARAIAATRKWCREDHDPETVRKRIMTEWGNQNFTDVVMNLPFVVMALVLGNGDFGRTICMAVNCGGDADCTGATAGAVMGIAFPDRIGENWLRPIGRKLVINDGITGITPPATLDGFTDLIVSLRERVTLRPAAAAPSPEPDYRRLAIPAEAGLFRPWVRQDDGRTPPRFPAKTEKITLPGFFNTIPAAPIPLNALYMIRIKFWTPTARKVRFMLNSSANNRAWLDGAFVLGRENGRMAPSFHRAPINQYKDWELTAGEHELLLGLAPNAKEKEISWVFGFGNASDKQWVTDFEFHS